MKRTRPSEIKSLLTERDIHPSRVLGQNFLIDQNILEIILDSAHLATDDTVLEIGPGLGVLTEHLVQRAHRVIAIEKDPRLAAYLREAFADRLNLTLIEGDALAQDLPTLLEDEAISHVVSNLPYASGTRMLIEMIHADARPLRLVVMLQLDVAERLTAAPGSKVYGLVSILAQTYYDILIRKSVSATCFYPPPDVRSALVEFFRLPQPRVTLGNPEHWQALTKWCFSQRRKQMHTILQRAPQAVVGHTGSVAKVLQDIGIAPDQRPESIAVEMWGELSNRLCGD